VHFFYKVTISTQSSYFSVDRCNKY